MIKISENESFKPPAPGGAKDTTAGFLGRVRVL